MAVARGDVLVQGPDALLVGDVDLERELPGGAVEGVDAHHGRALVHEQGGAGGADAAGRAGDHADLAVEPSGHQWASVA